MKFARSVYDKNISRLLEVDNAKRILKLLGLRFETNTRNCNYIFVKW